MFNHTYNFQSVNTEGPGAPAAGVYTVEVVQVTDKVSQKSGKDMLEIKLKIVDAAEEANKKFLGRFLFYYLVDGPDVDQKIFDIFTACFKPIPPQLTGQNFINLRGKVKTKVDTYNGEQRASVNYWCRPKPGETPPEGPKNPADDIPF